MNTIKQSILFFFFMSLIVCGFYPMLVTVFGKIFFKESVDGGVITYQSKKVGAELIGQEFSENKFFWARPSSVNYNASASGASNYSLTNPDLQKLIFERRTKNLNDDLLTSSGSGLDPHISINGALMQIERVALARGKSNLEIKKIIERNIEKRQWGFLGEQRINVLMLNLDLEKMSHE